MISVVLASFNGERYIDKQIDSILKNLHPDDELIISDDGSTDRTLEIIVKRSSLDKRIKVFNGPRLGVVRNFEYAIQKANGEYIFLSDQDDVWVHNKVEQVIELFKDGTNVVLHDAEVRSIDLNDVIIKSFLKFRKARSTYFANLIKNSFIGCCMAFRRDFLKVILPFPQNINMHDQWIGLMAAKLNSVAICWKPLIYYRRHDSNVTGIVSKNSLFKKIKIRLNMHHNVLSRYKVIKK